MYATTRDFLDYFNLRSLEELPSLAEIRDLSSIGSELDLAQDSVVATAFAEHNDAPAGELHDDGSTTQENNDEAIAVAAQTLADDSKSDETMSADAEAVAAPEDGIDDNAERIGQDDERMVLH